MAINLQLLSGCKIQLSVFSVVKRTDQWGRLHLMPYSVGIQAENTSVAVAMEKETVQIS